MANSHTILSQAEIDALVQQLSKATEQSYNEGFQAASEAIAEDNDYTTGYNQPPCSPWYTIPRIQ